MTTVIRWTRSKSNHAVSPSLGVFDLRDIRNLKQTGVVPGFLGSSQTLLEVKRFLADRYDRVLIDVLQ